MLASRNGNPWSMFTPLEHIRVIMRLDCVPHEGHTARRNFLHSGQSMKLTEVSSLAELVALLVEFLLARA